MLIYTVSFYDQATASVAHLTLTEAQNWALAQHPQQTGQWEKSERGNTWFYRVGSRTRILISARELVPPTDALRDLAVKILEGDPVALDVLKC